MKLAEYEYCMSQALAGNLRDLEKSVLPNAQFQHYLRSIQENTFRALDACFPCCRRLIGDDCWYGLLQQYLPQQQATHADLSHLGKNLAEFIQTTPLHEQLAYLSDMATFEWQWYQCFHGPLGNEKTLTSNFALARLWEMCQPEYTGDFQLPATAIFHFSIRSTKNGIITHTLKKENR